LKKLFHFLVLTFIFSGLLISVSPFFWKNRISSFFRTHFVQGAFFRFKALENNFYYTWKERRNGIWQDEINPIDEDFKSYNLFKGSYELYQIRLQHALIRYLKASPECKSKKLQKCSIFKYWKTRWNPRPGTDSVKFKVFYFQYSDNEKESIFLGEYKFAL